MTETNGDTPPAPQTDACPEAEGKHRQQIPGYQILQKLGAGAMAVVFKARQLSLNRIVAVKVLPKKLSADEEYVRRFYDEGRSAAKLNHPNIVQAIDVGEAHGYHYFVMEYVEGRTVYEELCDGKVYGEHEALGVALQMARALQHAHSQGLLHRDVKPKNIMLTTGGLAKLMDMGLARVADDAKAIADERGKLYGTPYYISPEQIVGKSDLDFRCDIYGLGATLYHMVTGQPPFDGKDAKEVMLKHCKEPLVPPDRHNIDLSFGTVKVIQKMMAKDRSNRHHSTESLIEDLQSVDFLLEVETDEDGSHDHFTQHLPDNSPPAVSDEEPLPSSGSPPPPPKPVAETPSALPRQSRILWIALGISLVFNVLLILLVLLLMLR